MCDDDRIADDVASAFALVDGQISQQSLADSFKVFYPDSFAYDWTEGRWYRFHVFIWLPQHSIMDAIAEWIGVIMNKAKAKETTRAKWLNAANYHGVETILKSMLAAEFNTIVNLVAFTNGYALDTDTGEIDHVFARHYISKYLPEGINGNFDEISMDFDNTVWDSLSHFELADRFAVKDFMQQFFGSALTGECQDEAMLFLYGPPGSGKSTVVEPIVKALGDYAASVYGGKVAKESNSHLEWLARLEGIRIVSISELPDKGHWQTDALNDLIGGGVITANKMHQNTREYVSKAHVVATGNSRPRAAGGSGLWRRMKIVHFDHKPEVVDKTLKQRFLTTEQPGIFAWLLKGLDDWINNGRQLTTPRVIEADVQEYQESSEPVAEFISKKCAMGGSSYIAARDLFEAYTAWYITDIGDKPLSIRRFGTVLRELGIEPPGHRNRMRSVVIGCVNSSLRQPIYLDRLSNSCLDNLTTDYSTYCTRRGITYSYVNHTRYVT